MDKLIVIKILSLIFTVIVSLTGCSFLESQIPGGMPSVPGSEAIPASEAISIGQDLYKAATLTDEEVREYSKQIAAELDSQNKIAPESSSYAARLNRLVAKHRRYEDLDLNYKVYLTEEVNAFALPDGSIRVYAGLMDRMNDEQLLSVIGHEIGHVKHGHSRKQMQQAYVTSGALKAASAGLDSATSNTVGGAATMLGGEIVAKIAASILEAQFSQSDETESDEFGVQFLAANGHNPYASVEALAKLGEMEGEGDSGGVISNFLSSHPRSEARVTHIKSFIAENGLDKGGWQPAVEEKTQVKVAAADRESDNIKADSKDNIANTYAGVESNSVTAKVSVEHNSVQDSNSYAAGNWYVQVAAFPDHEQANSMKEALLTRGEKALTRDAVVNGTEYRRVLVGPYSSASSAASDLNRVTELGIFEGTPFYRRLD